MKDLQTLLIIFTAALFFTACEKDETPENFNAISGVLTAGENVSTDDFEEMNIYAAKLSEDINLLEVNTNNSEINFTETTTVNSDGSFSFENLDFGNYIIALSEDFLFDVDTFCSIVIDGKTQNQIKRTIIRTAAENWGNADYKYPSGRSHPGKLKTRKIKVFSTFKYSMKDKGQIQSLVVLENSEKIYTINCKTGKVWSFKAEFDNKIRYEYRAVFKNGDQIINLNPIKEHVWYDVTTSKFNFEGTKLWYCVGWNYATALYFDDFSEDANGHSLH